MTNHLDKPLLGKRRALKALALLSCACGAMALAFVAIAVLTRRPLAAEQRVYVEGIRSSGAIVSVEYRSMFERAFECPAIVGISFADNSRSSITDAQLEGIECLTALRTLDLSNTSVTDSGAAELQGLSEIQILDLENTKITDSSVVYLSKLKTLRELNIENTGVSQSGANVLQRNLPRAVVTGIPRL